MLAAQRGLAVYCAGTSRSTTRSSLPPRELYHLLSSLNFLFLASHNEAPASAGAPGDTERFGDGFTTACCALLHLMGERGMFDVCDITRQVLSAHVSDVRARPGEVGTSGQQASASATGVKRQLQSVMQAFSSRTAAATYSVVVVLCFIKI